MRRLGGDADVFDELGHDLLVPLVIDEGGGSGRVQHGREIRSCPQAKFAKGGAMGNGTGASTFG
jgi:hypothetical protein